MIVIESRSVVVTRMWREGIAKSYKGKFWDGNSLCLDCGNGYMTKYICQNSLNCTLKLVSFLLYVNYTSVKVIKTQGMPFIGKTGMKVF